MPPDAAPALPPFEELYARHRARALAIARRILRDPTEAEDLVQEVFSRLWNGDLPFDGRASCATRNSFRPATQKEASSIPPPETAALDQGQ